MAQLTVANYLGLLQENPDDAEAIAGLREALTNGVPEDAVRLIEMARMAHEQRGELRAAAWLIELEAPLISGDPDLEAALFKELGRIRREELLDDAGAKGAYARALELRPGDYEIEDAIEQVDQAASSWKEIAKRFIEEAEDASDATLKTSLLTRAASLIWQYKKKGRDKEVDKLFKLALEADPASTRTARLYAETLRERDRWEEQALVLKSAAEHARNRDDKLNLFVRAGRVYAKRLDKETEAASCYERVLDFSPGHEEALKFLVEHFTKREDWDHLVALYEDALRSRQKLESEQGILMQIGMVHWRIRNAPDDAEPYFNRLRKSDPAHPGMLAFYREHLRQKGDAQRLLTVLGDAQRVSKDAGQKLELAVELARAAEESEATVERAIDAWKAVQRLDPSHPEAKDALRKLYRRAEKWNALVELLKTEIDALGDDAGEQKVTLLREMIPIYREKLSLDVMVINTYNAILQLVPDDAEALAALGQTYEAMGRWNDLIQVLTRQAEHTDDPTQKVELFMRVADLWIDRFANYNQATKPLEEVIAVDPENRKALNQLKGIYEKKRAWGSLFEVLRKEANLASDPTARLESKVELARLAGERLHKNAEAIELWKEVVEEAPQTDGALDALERLAEREKDWDTLASVLERRVSMESNEEARVKLLTKLGTVYGEHVDDPAMAATAWKRVLALDPKNGRATRTLRESFLKAGDWDALETLYGETDDWEGLVEVLGTAADKATDTELKKSLSFRAAEIYETRIGEPYRAFRNYERVLSVDPTDARAAAALVPIYERDENWARLSQVKEVLLAAHAGDTDPSAQVEILGELVSLALERLSDAAGAFEHAKRAYALAPEDKSVVKSLERAAAAAFAWEDLKKVFEARLAEADEEESLAIRRKLAGLAGERLGNTDAAIAQLEQILASDPSDADTIEVLDRLYRAENRTADLRALFQHRVNHAPDAAERIRCLRELATLEEDVLEQPDAAVARYEQLLTIEPDDLESLAALDRLHLAADWPKQLAEVLRRRRELTENDAERADLVYRLGELYRTRLEDPRAALDAYADVLRIGTSNDRAIAGLEALQRDVPELRLEVGRLLERAYESRSSYDKLVGVLEQRLASTDDPTEQRELQLRLAELVSSELGDHGRAYQAIEAAFLAHKTDVELWDRLRDAAERANKFEAMAEAYEKAIDSGELGASDIVELARRTALVYDEVVGNRAAAEPFHKRVLAEDSLDERAFEALKELYTNSERWDELQILYRNRIAHTIDAEQKLELLLQVCFLFEELLDDAELAIRAYQDVIELEPTHSASRRALERLYRRTERFRDLAAHLRQDLDGAEGQDRLALTFELAELHEKRLNEPVTAVDHYEQVLAENPTHLRSQEALERLLVEPTQRQRVAAILEPLYDAQGAYPELLRVLEVQLEDIADPGSQVGLLLRIADLAEVKTHDTDKAFAALSRAVKIDPADGRAREELARLSQIRGSERERAEVLAEAVENVSETYLLGELLMSLAQIYDESLGDMEKAEATYERLIRVDGDNPDAVLPASRALERIHIASQEYAKLVTDLRRQVKLENDPDARRALLVRLADLLEDTLEDVDGAIAAHRERLDADPNDIDAMRALERLYEKKEEWQRLIGVLQNREGAITDETEQRDIARRIGAIYEEKLDDADNAIVAYNEVLSRFGADRETLGALARLYERTEKWDDLLEVLLLDYAEVEDPIERASLRFRAAELRRLKTGDVERSIEGYNEVLAIVPDHEGALEALEAVMAGDDRFARIAAAQVLAPRYEGSADYGKLIDVLLVVAETEDPVERLRALRRAAEIADVGLESPTKAFEVMGRAIKAGLGEPDLGTMLADLERHAVSAGAFEDYVTLLRDVVPDIFDGELRLDVLLKIADTAERRLENLELAQRYYKTVLEEKPDHREALDALEALYARTQNDQGLLDVLRQKTDLAERASDRIDLLLRQAELSESKLEDVPAAIDAYERVLSEEERPEAYDGLERLYRQDARWNDLAALLERRLDAISNGGPGNPVAIRYRLGQVSANELGDVYRAIDNYREALARDTSHADTIAALEKLMMVDEHKAQVAEILEPVFLQQMNWPKVTGALEARLSAESSTEERKALLGRLGQIHEDYLEDLEGAMETYARLFREDPVDEESWETLTRLARNLDKHARLAEIYGEALADISVDEPATAKLSFITGRLHDEKTHDLDQAAKFYRRALDFDPTDRLAFDSLESVYRRQNDDGKLLGLYRERIDVAPGDAERVTLLHKMAVIKESTQDDPDGAIEVYREVLEIDPRDMTAIDALDRLYALRERWQDLADHVRYRIDQSVGTPDELPLKHRLGELQVDALGDREGALDTFEEITQMAPTFAPTVQKLEQMVMAEDDRLRITQILEPIYRGTDEWKKLIAILEAQAHLADDPIERVRLLGEIGRLHEERGHNGELAFGAWARAFVEDPHDEEVRAEIDRLAQIMEAWDHQVHTYEQALEKTDDSRIKTELLTTIARVHDERRGDPRSAIETYERLLAHDPDDPSPLDALEALHTMVGDWRGLVDVLERKVQRSYEPDERGELERRAGSVLEELLGDREGAIRAYERATQENERDDIALEALDRLYAAAGEQEKLADVLGRRVDIEEDPNTRVELGLRLGNLLESQLGRHQDAIDAYVRVLDDEAQNMGAIDALARLYERQAMWPELLDNIRLRAATAESTDTRVTLLHRAGEVLEKELDDVHEALSTYEEVLNMDGRFGPTIDALIRISNLEDYRERASEILEPRLEMQERWDDLARLLERKIDGTHDAFEKKRELVRLAHVHEQGRRDLNAAFEATSRALAEDPGDGDTADTLERLGASLSSWGRVADVMAQRASQVLDPSIARTLYVRLARIAEEDLSDDVRAIEAYARAAEQVGDDEQILSALDRLYVKSERWNELGDVLERRINATMEPGARSELLLRLGSLRETHFGDLRGALSAYQEVLEREPSDPIALSSIERLTEHEELASDAVEMLDSAYRQTGALDKVAALYDVKIRLADSDGERVRLLIEVAALYENELAMPDKALVALRQAFERDPRDESLLADVERLAGASGAWESLRGLVEAVAGSADLDHLVVRDLHLRAAGWYRDRLGDLGAAEGQLRAAIAVENDSPDAHRELAELLRAQAGREKDLVAALRAWAAIELDETAKKDRLREAARLAESALDDMETAAACHEAILEIDPNDLEALAELTGIRGAEERWDDVVDLLSRRIDAEMDPASRLLLRHELAAIYGSRLNRAEDAMAAYRGVLDEDPTDLRAIEALEELYEKGERWQELSDLLERRLDIAKNEDEQIAARVRLARLVEQQFGRRDDAMEQLRAILEIQPNNGDALDELERLFALDGRWDDLIELLERRIGDATAAGDVEKEVALLMKLAKTQNDELADANKAMATYERVLDKSPGHVDALEALLALHEGQKDWGAVAGDLERLLAVRSGESAIDTAHRLADVAQNELSDAARAEGALRAAFALDPSRAESKKRLMDHLEKHERWADLAEMLAGEESEQSDVTQKVELLKRIAAIYEEKLGDPGRAAEALERASKLTPEDREVLLPLCDLYIAAGRSNDAIPVLRMIIESYGTRRVKEVAQYHHRLGRALEGMGDLAGALEAYDNAFKVDLTNVAVLRDLGKLCHKQGDHDRAQKTFRALLLQKLDGKAGITKADVYFYLGDLSVKQNDKAKAKSMLQRALAEDKDHADAKALLETL